MCATRRSMACLGSLCKVRALICILICLYSARHSSVLTTCWTLWLIFLFCDSPEDNLVLELGLDGPLAQGRLRILCFDSACVVGVCSAPST